MDYTGNSSWKREDYNYYITDQNQMRGQALLI